MSARQFITGGRGCRRWTHSVAALALAWGGSAFAQDVVSVPAAHLHHAEGSVAYAPQGDKEWHDVQPRRLLKRGDRLWTDHGSRAEVQAGGHALRLNGETQMVLENVGETATQLSLTQGSMVATVTRMNPGDSFEVGTPNLAFRARQTGDYRIDVDTKQGVTRVVVLSGLAVVYGEQGEAMEVRSGQRITFRERRLARVQQPLFAATDDFDRWTSARRRGEPTVSMPMLAQGTAPAQAPMPRGLVNKGPDLIIKGSAAEVAAQTGIPARSAPAVAANVTRQQAAVAAATVTTALPPASVAVAITPPPATAKPIPTSSSATPLKVIASSAPGSAAAAQLQAQAQAQIAQAQAVLQAQAAAQAQAQAAAQAQVREQERQRRLAQQRADDERHAAQQRAEDDRRAAAARADQVRRSALAAEARRIEEHRRAVAGKRAEEDRRHLQARREAELKHFAAVKRAEEERHHAQVQARAAEEKRLEAMRRADAQKLAELRQKQIARLQEQARRDEQSAVLRRAEQARRADDDRREEQARREDQARREEDYRRQRALAEQARREQARRDEEVWLRQQQNNQPLRPAPMGVPFRRVS